MKARQLLELTVVTGLSTLGSGSTLAGQAAPANTLGTGQIASDSDKPVWPWSSDRKSSIESPPLVVEALNGYVEEEKIGSYGQPRWIAHRRFPATGVFVRPECEIETEQWFVWKRPCTAHQTSSPNAKLRSACPIASSSTTTSSPTTSRGKPQLSTTALSCDTRWRTGMCCLATPRFILSMSTGRPRRLDRNQSAAGR